MFLNDAKAIYRSAWRFAVACPILFAIPVLVEFAQHAIEMRAGMYLDEAGAVAAEGDTLRMQFGFLKVLAIQLPGYWFVRYIVLGHDANRAGRLEMPAIALWFVIFALLAVTGWLGMFGPSLAGVLGISAAATPWFDGGMFVLEMVLTIYLIGWAVAWAVGNAAIGPVRSFAIMNGSFWYALGLFAIGFLPLMIPHYGLAILAVLVLPTSLDWVAMAIDSLLVGYLALTMAGASAYAAIRAAERRGISLLPDEPAGSPRFVAKS